MAWGNTQGQYGTAARSFHLLMALLILTMLGLGLYMTDNLLVVQIKLSLPEKIRIFGLHKSLGVLVLMLVVPRLLLRIMSVHPIPLPTHKQWERGMARAVHGLLYVCMFVMPLTGWIGSSAKGNAVSFFGLFTLPDLVGRNEALAKILWTTHFIVACSLLALVVLHIAGALKHHLIDRDDTLRRMIPFLSRP